MRKRYLLFLGLIWAVILSCMREPKPEGRFTSLNPEAPDGTANLCFTVGQKAYVGIGATGSLAPVGGGHNLFYEYDSQQDAWTSKAALPAGERYQAMGFALEGKVYVGGGSNSVPIPSSVERVYSYYQDFWQYDPQTNQWQEKKPLPVKDSTDNELAGVSLAGKGYLLEIRQNEQNTTLWQYDSAEDAWQSLAPLPATAFEPDKERFSFFAIGQQAYCLFYSPPTNQNSTWQAATALWEYTPGQNRWVKKRGPGQYDYLFTIGRRGYFAQRLEGHQPQQYQVKLWEYDPLRDKTIAKNSVGTGMGFYPDYGFSIGNKGYFSVQYRTDTKQFWSFAPALNLE